MMAIAKNMWLYSVAVVCCANVLITAPGLAATSKTAGMAGSVTNSCKFTGKNSFPIQVVVSGNGSNRSVVITFDGTTSSTVNNNAGSVSVNYTLVCNATSNLTLTANRFLTPAPYDYTVMATRTGNTVGPVSSSGNPGTAPLTPILTTGTAYTIQIGIPAPANSIDVGTFSTTVTIQ